MYNSEKSLISMIKSHHLPVTITIKIEYKNAVHTLCYQDDRRRMTVKSLLFQQSKSLHATKMIEDVLQ